MGEEREERRGEERKGGEKIGEYSTGEAREGEKERSSKQMQRLSNHKVTECGTRVIMLKTRDHKTAQTNNKTGATAGLKTHTHDYKHAAKRE